MYVKAKVTSKYQITLPRAIRQRLGIEKGDEIVFEDRGQDIIITVEKRTDPVEAIEGLLAGDKPEELRRRAASRILGRKLGT
jgi:antitoxin PrlF